MAHLTAGEIARFAGIRELESPENPLARKLITTIIESGVRPDPVYHAQLAVAWRDGKMTEAELTFCEQMQIDPELFVRIRRELGFAEILAHVFDLDVQRLRTMATNDEGEQ